MPLVDNIAAMSPLPDQIVDLVRRLRLAPHPEGGWFRELYRDRAVTTIYYVMEPRSLSPLHRLRTRSELWHFYGGAPVELHTIGDGGDGGCDGDGDHGRDRGDGDGDDGGEHEQEHRVALLSPDAPVAVVPPGAWQAARVVGDEPALLGCTVAPAFDFADWHMPSRAELQQRFPTLTALVAALTRP
ncbi:MAG TPA: cupin domain-containing protein [Polyangia bacterium]|jgi:hypothetical protein|nr:cupin domain-containing protein [Polyangia bacterium]